MTANKRSKTESLTICANINNRILITPKGENTDIILTPPDAERIALAVRRYYCANDIIDYFTDNDEYPFDAIEDPNIMDHLLYSYVKYREESDGGDFENLMHWSECLAAAIADNKDELEKYRKKRKD